MTDDQLLVRRIQSGDREALETLYLRYLPTVWRFACAQLPRQGEAARDVVSETFLSAIRGIRDYDFARGSVSAWLIGIARHKVADFRRRDARTLDAPLRQAEDDPAWQLDEDDIRQAIGAIMADLDDDHRQVLEWKYLENLSTREIAAQLGRTEKGVEALLYRARAEFRNHCAAKRFVKESHDEPRI